MEDSRIKRFDSWNEQKKVLDQRVLPDDFFFLEGEVWWAAVGINIGHEIDGKNDLCERPILVVKKLDEGMLWALPMTSRPKEGKDSYTIRYRGFKYFLLLGQARSISIKRLLRLVRRINQDEFSAILNKIHANLFSIKTIPSD